MSDLWRLLKRSTVARLLLSALTITCLLNVLLPSDHPKVGKNARHEERGNSGEHKLERGDGGSTDGRQRDRHSLELKSWPTISSDKPTLGRNGDQRLEDVLLLDLSGTRIKVEMEINHRVNTAFENSSSFSAPRRLALPPSIQSLVSDTFLENLQQPVNVSKLPTRREINRTLLEDVFRSGFGLESYVTENGDEGWIENGVVYRPVRKSKAEKEKKLAFHDSDFEAYVPFDKEFFFGGDKKKSAFVNTKEKKIILWYTKARYVPNMADVEPMRSCPDFPCGITTNRKYQRESAAMLFAGQIIRGLPPKRSSSNQIFVFHNQEPPLAKWFHRPTFNTAHWKGVFNWTMSYRLDSDIASHYGILRKRPRPVVANKNYTSILAKKSHLVAWVVSHCSSPGGREKYVRELQKYIPVDIYGDCGKLKCARAVDNKCAEMITTKYKFYLSFENAICPDYITEKFFRYMSLDVITVARASNQLSQHAPSEIFLNTADFVSPRQLAKTILYLHKHDDLYIKMLQEKDKYMQLYEDYVIRDKNGVVKFTHYHYEAVPFCEMCQKLWNLERSAKVIPDISEWFGTKVCKKPTDLIFR